jgi:hypothetical protein
MNSVATFARSALPVLLCLLLGFSLAGAGTAIVDFGGERFVNQFEGPTKTGRLVEFVRANETVKTWTKLVGFYSYPDLGNDATRGAAGLAQVLKQKNLKYQLINNPKTAEAIIDFLAFANETVEFNVFKYAPAAKGLVAAQYAYRFKLGELDADDVKALRKRAVDEMARFDMAPVKAHFAQAR